MASLIEVQVITPVALSERATWLVQGLEPAYAPSNPPAPLRMRAEVTDLFVMDEVATRVPMVEEPVANCAGKSIVVVPNAFTPAPKVMFEKG